MIELFAKYTKPQDMSGKLRVSH